MRTCRESFKYCRPGFCRLNLPYTITEDELDFVLEAVEKVTNNGWMLLPMVSEKPFIHI